MIRPHTKLISLLCFLLLGCGGGGGGGSSSGGSATTGVRVLNTSMDLPPVSLTTTAKVGETISTTKFAEVTGFSELPKGAQTISVQTVDGGTGPFNFSVTIQNRDRPQVLVYGTRETYGINATLLESEKPKIPDGFAAVRIAHGTTGAASIKGSVGGQELPEQVNIGNASKYLFVPAGASQIKVIRSVDSRSFVNQQVQVENGKAYTFVVNGEIDYLVMPNLLED